MKKLTLKQLEKKLLNKSKKIKVLEDKINLMNKLVEDHCNYCAEYNCCGIGVRTQLVVHGC